MRLLPPARVGRAATPRRSRLIRPRFVEPSTATETPVAPGMRRAHGHEAATSCPAVSGGTEPGPHDHGFDPPAGTNSREDTAAWPPPGVHTRISSGSPGGGGSG